MVTVVYRYLSFFLVFFFLYKTKQKSHFTIDYSFEVKGGIRVVVCGGGGGIVCLCKVI